MDHESTSFNPKTWVSSEPIEQLIEADEVAEGAAKKPHKALIAGGLAALALPITIYAFWPSGSDQADASVAPAPVESSSQDTALAPGISTRIVQVSGMNDLGFALEAMGIDTGDAFVLAQETVAALGVEGEMRVSVEMLEGENGQSIQSLIAELEDGTAVRLTRAADGSFERERLLDTAEPRIRSASGVINHNTFYVSAVEAGIPDSLVTEFAKAFAFDFNFQTEVGIGAKFNAVWEERITETGRPIGAPKLLEVTLETTTKSRTYFSFIAPDANDAQWYDSKGFGNVRSLMQTPVDGARITSKFGYRTHPISQVRKKHRGVDFAAPTGTPIYASGNATVTFRAMAGGAGNLVKLDHGDGMETKYMHLDQFAEGLTVGQPVRQGEIIGYVGTTGGSTGPHLHYEIWVEGVDMDPLTFETSEQEQLAAEALTMFKNHRENLVALIESAKED